MTTIKKLHELEASLRSVGCHHSTDRYRVCRHAMSYLGLPYEMTEELTDSTIDCSTLTSQSHWEGAAITIPFIAESQRVADSGRTVARIEDALPGDIFIRYQSVSRSPDGKFNHVGLFLGHDETGTGWVIEARGGKGVILTPSSEFPPEGGIKRYLPLDMRSYDSPSSIAALALASRVPKLGRPGARQYLRNSDERRIHRGVDIYVQPGTPAYAPISGFVKGYICELENARGFTITSEDNPFLTVSVLHIEGEGNILSSVVDAGERIGLVVEPKSDIVRYVDGITQSSTHLHLEAATVGGQLGELEPYLTLDGICFYNPLLLIKLGKLTLPLESGVGQQ